MSSCLLLIWEVISKLLLNPRRAKNEFRAEKNLAQRSITITAAPSNNGSFHARCLLVGLGIAARAPSHTELSRRNPPRRRRPRAEGARHRVAVTSWASSDSVLLLLLLRRTTGPSAGRHWRPPAAERGFVLHVCILRRRRRRRTLTPRQGGHADPEYLHTHTHTLSVGVCVCVGAGHQIKQQFALFS